MKRLHRKTNRRPFDMLDTVIALIFALTFAPNGSAADEADPAAGDGVGASDAEQSSAESDTVQPEPPEETEAAQSDRDEELEALKASQEKLEKQGTIDIDGDPGGNGGRDAAG